MINKYFIIYGIIILSILIFILEKYKYTQYVILLSILSLITYLLYHFIKNKNYYIIIPIILIFAFIIGVGITGIINILDNKTKIDKNWSEYKCKVQIMPFAGWLIGPSNINPTSNFKNCIEDMNNSFFEKAISPFVYIITIITKILDGLVGDIQNMRKMVNYLRNNIEDALLDIYSKIYDSYARLAYLFQVLLKIMSKLFDVFDSLFDTLKYIFYTFASIWNGPIGEVVKFFCFDKNTLIRINKNKYKKIKNIKVGDIIFPENKVTAIMKFSSKNVIMYNYKSIIVSGEHIVYENNKWIKVKDSYISIPIKYKKKYIYCINTETSTITSTNNILFKDYNETKEKTPAFDFIYNTVCNSLKSSTQQNIYNDIYQWGFDKDTLINGKKIKHLKIGHSISEPGFMPNIILAIIKLSSDDIQMYKLNNIVLSGSNIIYYNNEWTPVFSVKDAIKLTNYKHKYIYNIITSKNTIRINNMTFRDYEQIQDTIIEKYIKLNLD